MLSIIGCGNLVRSDDGVGVVVAQRLMQCTDVIAYPTRVNVFDAGTGGMDVMFRARGADKLIIIDASRSGSEPGAIYQVPGEELEAKRETAYSLHDFRWDHALYAGRKIFAASFPTDVTVFLIEAGVLAYGLELTAPVQRAADKVIATIEAIVNRYVSVAA